MKRNQWIKYKRPIPIEEKIAKVKEATSKLNVRTNNYSASWNNKLITNINAPDDKIYMFTAGRPKAVAILEGLKGD